VPNNCRGSRKRDRVLVEASRWVSRWVQLLIRNSNLISNSRHSPFRFLLLVLHRHVESLLSSKYLRERLLALRRLLW
jgi:hypothetical protein